MVNGRLACLGRLQHLTSRFGGCWQLEVHTKENAEQERLSALVRSLDSGAELMEQYRGRFTYRLPSQGMSLAAVFRRLEAARDAFGIEDYGVSQATLEQIFLTFAKQQRKSDEHGPS
jgi:ATP-binding cassette subfamily A (ABC1) protein 3